MKSIFRGAALRAHTSRRERLLLATLGILAVSSAAALPAFRAETLSWRERDFRAHYQAQQLFGRNAEDLNERELNDVLRWKRLIELTAGNLPQCVDRLSDEDCRFVIKTLDDLCPHLEEHAGYQLVNQACAARLAGDHVPPATAAAEAPRWQDMPVALE